MARPRLPVTHPGYVAGIGTPGNPASGNTPTGHITQPFT
jgi:hypothetical protein